MESNEGRSFGRSLRELKPGRGSARSPFKGTWLGRNWSTVLILVAIVLLALFVRSYFGFSTSVDNGFLVGGGSDSYYHQRVIDYVNSEGSHLVQDPALDYPFGMRNPRPPMYDWSVAVTSQILAGMSGLDITDAAGYSLVFSSAVWGALTCIPVYMITRGAFGNRAGILAALLFAFMPGHISRSVIANADHDAFILFFVVFALYFLMRALQAMKGTKWVSSWKKPDTIRSGLKSYFQQNQKSLIYAVLGGICIAVVAMAWTGYTYLLVIVLVYLLVQVLVNRFRNVDSMGEFFIVGVMLLTAFALIAPMYWQLMMWQQWFDVPFYLFVGSMIIGGFFTVTRDYPWTLTIPAIIAIVAAGLAALFFLAPDLFESIISGQGYLVKSKLYSTIDEASAPEFSTLVLSFGPVTFWLAIIGLVWAAIKIPKNPSPYLVFVVVWMGVGMYMAASASRFMFNASPAFAMAGGWILALIIGMAKFTEVPRMWTGFWSNPRSTFRKAFKLRYVGIALFLALLIVLPNVWTAVDAGIPSQTKSDYDKQLYDAMPDFLRPENYDDYSYWYLGAFGYSLPLPETYWPAAWAWFSTQDSDTANIEDRPAFLSWWDYGFEAIQAGQHPAVSDNFQNSYMYAGSFLTAQNESDAVALLNIRILEKVGFNSTTMQILQQNGVNVAKLQDIMQNPEKYVDEVKNNPLIYGPYDSELSAENAKYAAARIELEKIGLENMVALYNELREASGIDIGYFAVDGRLFPFSATSSNIFYAPATLSDRVIDSYTKAPTDYYEILVITTNYETKKISELDSDDVVLTYTIQYNELFYDTMLYRMFMGISPSDIGSTSQGIPGISGSMTSYDAMPGYNLTHFKQVYRTAYYNPYTDYANHSGAWQAVSWDEALILKERIDAGEEGTVDMTSAGLQSGVVFLQYYDGVILNGTAQSSDGSPYAGIYVTVVDEYGIPHQVVETDANGQYSVILPFGDVSVVYSAGNLSGSTLIATEIQRVNYTISYDQAMREPGTDWTLEETIVLPAAVVTGSIFYDTNGNGRYDAGEQYISGASVTLTNPSTGFDQTVTTGAMGSYRIIGLAGGSQTLTVTYDGHTLGESTVTLTSSGVNNRSVGVKVASVTGTVSLASGSSASGVSLTLEDKANGNKYKVTSDSSGKYTFSDLLPGNYTLYTSDTTLSVGTQSISLTSGQQATKDLKLVKAATVSGIVTIDGVPQANVPVVFHSEQREVSVLTNETGAYSLALPYGVYSVYAVADSGGKEYAAVNAFTADSDTSTLNIALTAAAVVTGTVWTGENGTSGASVVYSLSDGAYVKASADAAGKYNVILPCGNYSLYSAGSGKSYWVSSVSITANTTQDITLGDSVYLTGKVYRDLDGDGELDDSEVGIANALLKVWLSGEAGRTAYFVSSSSGSYNISVPAGSYILNVTLEGYSSWQGSAGLDIEIPLVALNRTVTGTVDAGSGVTVTFKPTGDGESITVVTGAGGAFSVELPPASYWVIIEQNVTAGDDSARYYYNSTLTVPIARDPDALDIEAAVQYRVNATVAGPAVYDSDSTVRFVGPENKTVSVNDLPIYLEAGDYTIYVDLENNDAHYVYLDTITVGVGGTELGELTAVYAGVLRGQLQYDGEDLSAATTVTITAPGGIELPVTSNSAGEFNVYLVNGTYEVSAEYQTKTTLEDDSSRYVIYQNETMPVTVSGETIKSFELERSLANVTLSGTVDGTSAPGVNWQFVALSDTAMDSTNATGTGDYEVKLAPGTYSVYAYADDGSNAVYLGIVDITSDGNTMLNVTLAPGHRVYGTVTNDGVPQADAEVTFVDNAQAKTTTDASGQYSIWLPNGYYNVAAKAIVAEHHPGEVNMTYAWSADLAVIGDDVQQDMALELVDTAVVEIVWNAPATIPTINPGESVTYDITVYNLGNLNDTYELSTTSDWGVVFSQTTVELPWGTGTGKTIQVTLTAPADAKVSHSDIKIVAKSVNRTGGEGSEALKVNIAPTYVVEVGQGSAPSTNGTAVTYSVLVKNTGTASDIFELNLTNMAGLASQGWDAKISGTAEQTKRLTIAAGSSQTVTVTLTRNDQPASTDIALDVTVRSTTHSATAAATLAVEKGALSVSDDQLTASGRGASMDAPGMTATTWVLLALIVITLAALVITRVNKGVLGRRRKR